MQEARNSSYFLKNVQADPHNISDTMINRMITCLCTGLCYGRTDQRSPLRITLGLPIEQPRSHFEQESYCRSGNVDFITDVSQAPKCGHRRCKVSC